MTYFKTTPHRAAKSTSSPSPTNIPANPNMGRASPSKPAPLVQKGGCASCGKKR